MEYVDVGLIVIGMDEVGESNEAIEEVTEAQVEKKNDIVELEH